MENSEKGYWHKDYWDKIEFTSELVKSYKSMYLRYTKISDKITFLINLYSEYRENHSFGEYDYMVIVEEDTEREREELSEFLGIEFNRLKDELNKLDDGKVANCIKNITTIKTSYVWQNNPDKELPELYNLMIDKYKLIAPETTPEQFRAVFTGQPIESINPIKWHQENASELLYFIDRLEQSNNIVHNSKRADYQKLIACFVKPDGKQFKAVWKSLKTNIEINLSPDKQKAIDELVNNF